jgi:hypothetical protein
MPKLKGVQLAIKAGLPLVVLLCGGSYSLSQFTQTQFEIKDKKQKRMSQKTFDIQEEHRRIQKSLNIDDYSLSRIPRPDEPESLEKARKNKKMKRV